MHMATIRNRHQPTQGTAAKVHVGVDFVVCEGQHVVSVGYGVVSSVLPGSGFGPRANGGSVMIFHFDPKTGVVAADLVYAHLTAIQVKTGDTVRRGQVLGEAWKPDEPDESGSPTCISSGSACRVSRSETL